MVPGRTNTLCRQRWVHTLDPAIGVKMGKWTPEEDARLKEAVKNHGTDWVAIAALVPSRTNEQCRRRWVTSLDPANVKNAGKWTPEEDAKLTEAVQKHGKRCWVTVAALVPGRMHIQCRSRWVHNLDPDRASNTVEEERNASIPA
jgi:Myb-like DNA-binding protein BAS1